MDMPGNFPITHSVAASIGEIFSRCRGTKIHFMTHSLLLLRKKYDKKNDEKMMKKKRKKNRQNVTHVLKKEKKLYSDDFCSQSLSIIVFIHNRQFEGKDGER